jgi:beta-glucosidase
LLKNDSLVVSVLVKNTSALQGAETVQLYYHDQVASITPSVKKLLAFKKITLQAGETQKVEFTVRAADLSFINKSLQRVTEPGMFDLLLANFKSSFYVD